MFDAGKISLPGDEAEGAKGGLDIMKKPLGKKPPMGDMGGMDTGGGMGGGLESALKGAGFPSVTPEQIDQIKAILGEPGDAGGMDAGGLGKDDMGGDKGGLGGLPM